MTWKLKVFDFWKFGDFIDLDPYPDWSNFVDLDPDTINPDPDHRVQSFLNIVLFTLKFSQSVKFRHLRSICNAYS